MPTKAVKACVFAALFALILLVLVLPVSEAVGVGCLLGIAGTTVWLGLRWN